jgi:integrase
LFSLALSPVILYSFPYGFRIGSIGTENRKKTFRTVKTRQEKQMAKNSIKTVADRKKLAPRAEPYWENLGAAYLGYRAGPDTWVGRIREDGKQNYQALGKFADYAAATKALREWLEQREADRKAGVDKSTSELTVADTCHNYINHLLETKGQRQHDHALGILQRSVLGREEGPRKPAIAANPIASIKLSDLSHTDFKAWRKGLLPDTEANTKRETKATATRVFAVFRAALNFAFNERHVASAAAWSGVKAFGKVDAGNDSRGYLTPLQRRAMINACENQDVRDMLEALAVTGARPVELLRAKVGDFDTKTGKIMLWSLKGKNSERRERIIPLKALRGAADVFLRLSKGKDKTAPLLNLRDWEQGSYFEHVQRAVADAGLPIGTSAYNLRHSFISDAIAASVPIHTIATVCGTSVAMIERTYGKLLEDHAEQAFGRMDPI